MQTPLMRLPISPLYGAALHVLAGAALPARVASMKPLAASNLALGVAGGAVSCGTLYTWAAWATFVPVRASSFSAGAVGVAHRAVLR